MISGIVSRVLPDKKCYKHFHESKSPINNSEVMTSLITINNALCRVGRHKSLKVEKLEIKQGEHWCFFGPNGSGKSLLANLLAGRRIESGNYVHYSNGFEPRRDLHIVSFEEQQRLWERDNRLDISDYTDSATDKGTSVLDLIKDSRPVKDEDQSLFDDLTEQLCLGPYLDKGIRFLSSGQVRRVLIARALYAFQPSSAQILVLDDPLESIDIGSQRTIRDAISEFLKEDFSSIQLCRRPSDILPGITHMAVMKELEIIEHGSIESVETKEAYLHFLAHKPTLPNNIPEKMISKHVAKEREPLIEMLDVKASYGEIQIFKGFSWSMMPSDHVLIEGPNGCGKSTLLSLIDGENHKAYGQNVTLFGCKKGSGETIWDLKSKFGVVSNELHNKYIKGWRVLDVVVSGFFDSIGLYDDSGAKEKEMAAEWLSLFGIESLVKNYYHEVSFGQQRLVLLARAMVKKPKILILDEPCVGLDDYHRQLILGVLDLIGKQTHTRLIYVSHVKEEKPSCINSRLSFVPDDGGGYRIVTSSD